MQKEKNSDIETNGKPKINYFLIRLPRNATEDEVKKIAKPCLLQYDSLVFGFKMNYGMDCLYYVFIWLILNEYKNLRNSYIDFLIIADKIEIFDIYKIGKNSEVSLKPFGIYDSSLKISMPEMWERRVDMEGHHLR